MSGRARRRHPVVVLLLLLLGQIGLAGLLFLLRDRLVFLPSAHPPPETGLDLVPTASGLRLVEVVRSDGRRLAAYDVSPSGLDVASPVVLFAHGNAGNIALRAPLVVEVARGTASRVLLLDYSGYGGNPGRPSEAEALRDGLAAYDHLRREGVPPSRIVLYGESLGGAIALGVARERPVAGVVVQSTFSSLSSMALRIYPWLPFAALFAHGRFPNAARAAALDVPLLVVHGERDEIIPFAEGQRLHRLAGEGAELLPIAGAGHNDLFAVAGEGYLRELGGRFRRWTQPTP